MKNKKELILNTMEQFMKEGTAGTCSVKNIADRAGIAKGGLYYYFKSKEEIMDAVVNRQYENIMKNVRIALSSSTGNALEKLEVLFSTYTTSEVDASLDEYLHLPQNAALHQKSLATILLSLRPMISEIFKEGINEGIFQADYPDEIAEIILASFTFLYDPGIFTWTQEDMYHKMKALTNMMETMLHTHKGVFDFLLKKQ